jgi:16S rRNA processing protein RimM
MEKTLVWIGRVVNTHGRRGQVKIDSREGGKTALAKGKKIYLGDREGRKRAFTVHSARYYREKTILEFSEVQDIQEAAQLIGQSVFIHQSDLEALPPDEFYWHQLHGLNVETEKGTALGKLEGVFSTGSNDVFVVRKDGEEFLIPAIEEIVRKVDLQKKVMIIRTMQGLLPRDDL